MDEFDLFAVKRKKANKTNSSVRFLGESMARQSASRFFLTFICSRKQFNLESLIDIGQGITVGPGKFVKRNKRRV